MVIKVRTDKRKRKPAKSMGGRLARVGQQYTTKGGYAYSAFKLARRLADAVNIEYKERDTANSITPSNNGTVVSLAGNIIKVIVKRSVSAIQLNYKISQCEC